MYQINEIRNVFEEYLKLGPRITPAGNIHKLY